MSTSDTVVRLFALDIAVEVDSVFHTRQTPRTGAALLKPRNVQGLSRTGASFERICGDLCCIHLTTKIHPNTAASCPKSKR